MLIENKINSMLHNIIKKNDLPENALYLYDNISPKGKNKGDRISISLCISEPLYPSNNIKGQKSYVIMNIQDHIDTVELLIRNNQFESISVPKDVNVKDLKSDKVFKHIIINKESENLYKYIE